MKQDTYLRTLNRNYAILVGIITIALFITASLPEKLLYSDPSVCLHYRLLGIECPFCGCMRSVNSFLHLDFVNSLRYNFNIYLLALLMPVLIVRIFSSAVLIKRLERLILILLAAGFLLIYIYRIFNSISHS